MVRVPHCHCGGRGFEPRQPRSPLNPHPVLLDGVLCFEPDMPEKTSTYHVPVLLKPVLTAARAARRVVDATLGDGGHAAGFLAAGKAVEALEDLAHEWRFRGGDTVERFRDRREAEVTMEQGVAW